MKYLALLLLLTGCATEVYRPTKDVQIPLDSKFTQSCIDLASELADISEFPEVLLARKKDVLALKHCDELRYGLVELIEKHNKENP